MAFSMDKFLLWLKITLNGIFHGQIFTLVENHTKWHFPWTNFYFG